MQPGLFDHLLVITFVIALPLHGALVTFPRLRQLLDRPDARRGGYFLNIVLQWVLVLWVLALWWVLDRPLASLGLSPPHGTPFWIGMAVVVSLAMIQFGQGMASLRDPDTRQRLRRRVHNIEPILPRSASEFRLFSALSVNAGITEELLFRGLLVQYLDAFGPTWLAWVGSTILFGMAHAYQGLRGMAQTALVGGLFLSLLLVTGSIWLSMLYHAAFNIVSGSVAYRLLSEPGRDDDDSGVSAPAGS